MRRDFRFGARMLLKQPGFTILAVLTLALGIGATSAVFSLIEGVLLSPPPYREPNRLVLVDSARTDQEQTQSPRGWAPVQWLGWQKEAKSLESVAAYAWTFNFLVLDEGSESLQGMPVTKDYFSVMGLQPVMGRTFTESEGRPGSAPVVIIGYELWQRKFNSDPNIIGKPMRLSRVQTPPTIIGVMPPGVRFLPTPMASKEPNYNVNAHVQYWVPAVPNPERLRQTGWSVIARLRPGASIDQAQTELSGAHRQGGRRGAGTGGCRAAIAVAVSADESGWQPHSPALTRRGRTGAADCLRKCLRVAARARPAATAGVRRAERPGRTADRAVPSSFDGKSAARAAGRNGGSRDRLRR